MKLIVAIQLAGLALSVATAAAMDSVISSAFFSRSLLGTGLHGAWRAQQPSAISANASSLMQLSEQLEQQSRPSAVGASRSLTGSLLADTASVLARELGAVRASGGSAAHEPTPVLVVCGGNAECGVARVLRQWLGGSARVWAVVGGGKGETEFGSTLHRDTMYGDADQAVFWRQTVFGSSSRDMATVVIDRGSGLSESQVLVSLRECLPHVTAGGSVVTVGGLQQTGVGAEAALVRGSLRTRELEARCGVASGDGVSAAPAASASLSWSALGSGLRWAPHQGDAGLYWAGVKRHEISPDVMERSGMGRVDDVRTLMEEASSPVASAAAGGRWGLDEELDSLVTDMHGWWGFSEVTATRPPGVVNAAGGSYVFVVESRRVRRSLLGERWRSWFMRSTEAISWGPSWTLIRRVHRVGSRSFPLDNIGGLLVQAVTDLPSLDASYRGYVGALPSQVWLDQMAADGAIPPREDMPPIQT